MWPPPRGLGWEFWVPFALAGTFCGSTLCLSSRYAATVWGRAFTDLSPATRKLWHCYTYCLCPGLIVSSMLVSDLHSLLVEGKALWDADALLMGPSSPGVVRSAGFSCGFLSFDLVVMLVWRTPLIQAMKFPMFLQMLVHHLFCIVFWPQSITRNLAPGVLLYLMITEATSLFINARWLLTNAKCDSGQLFLVNNILLFVSYLVVRILPIPWYYWALFTSDKSSWTWIEWICGWGSAPIPPALNLYWFSFILRAVANMIRGHGQPKNGKHTEASNGVEEKAVADSGASNGKSARLHGD